MKSTIELLTRILYDITPTSITDGAYLYCQTESNQESTFQSAKALLDKLLIPKILILRIEEKSGFPGYDNWKRHLQHSGVSEDNIEGIKFKNDMLNTLTESEALIQAAKQCGYHSLFVVSSPFHQLRAFMTAVTVALKVYPEIKIYSYPGTALPWNEDVVHSQGILKAKRHQLIQTELERITKYQNKGDLASAETVLDYLNKRD